MTRGFHRIVVLLVGLACPSLAGAQDAERGKVVYDSRCVVCHGEQGDRKGLIGIVHRAQTNGLVTTIYPRDFTAGVFKFRSTATGVLPTDEDLVRIVTDGISRSGMPANDPDLMRAYEVNYVPIIVFIGRDGLVHELYHHYVLQEDFERSTAAIVDGS